MNFFFDYNCGKQLMALAKNVAPEHAYEFLDESYSQDELDEVWIPEVAARSERWIAVSGDNRRFKSKVQIAALKDTGLTWVGLMGKFNNTSIAVIKQVFPEVWPKVVGKVLAESEPSIYKITFDNKRKMPDGQLSLKIELYKTLREI